MSNDLEAIFLNKTPLIDVRAPVEFQAGHLPHSINLPLMNDHERHLVGICYKEKGQESAIELGHRLVSGENKAQRIQAWIDYLKAHPEAQVMCLRGGLRSKLSCEWITQAGIERSPIPGGYKRLRQFLLSQIEEKPLPSMIRLGGMTGTGKTDLLKKIDSFVDLEELAHHRGSAFGERGEQPAQASFENALAAKLIGTKRVVVEDESSQLGLVRIPQRFFDHMQSSQLVILEASLEERVANIYRDYVQSKNQEFFVERVKKISKKLGGVRTQQLLEKLRVAYQKEHTLSAHEDWIKQLLVEYYDPAYNYSLAKNKEEQIVFRGKGHQIEDFFLTSSKLSPFFF